MHLTQSSASGIFRIVTIGEEIGPEVVKHVSVPLCVMGVGVLLAYTDKFGARTRFIVGNGPGSGTEKLRCQQLF